jgi:carbonic anhydrase
MRSIIVGIYELGIEEIMLIHHTDCGAGKMTGEHMKHLICERVGAHKVAEVERHIDLSQWLDGFGDTEKSVRATMRRVKNHALVPGSITVRGFIIDSTTGALTEIGK